MKSIISNWSFSTCIVFQVLKHIDFTICILCMAIFTSISNLFLYCHFGNLATDSFGGMSDCLYDAKWYGLPVGLQKYFILMIAIAQRKLKYSGFGIIVLDLETFFAVKLIQKPVFCNSNIWSRFLWVLIYLFWLL